MCNRQIYNLHIILVRVGKICCVTNRLLYSKELAQQIWVVQTLTIPQKGPAPGRISKPLEHLLLRMALLTWGLGLCQILYVNMVGVLDQTVLAWPLEGTELSSAIWAISHAHVINPSKNPGYQELGEFPWLVLLHPWCDKSLLGDLSTVHGTQLGEDKWRLVPGFSRILSCVPSAWLI